MKEKKQSLKSKVTYVKKNWMLYIFFLMPALLLTIIFKYVPMGGLLIAFKDYNVIKGVLGSPWVGLEYFKRFFSFSFAVTSTLFHILSFLLNLRSCVTGKVTGYFII